MSELNIIKVVMTKLHMENNLMEDEPMMLNMNIAFEADLSEDKHSCTAEMKGIIEGTPQDEKSTSTISIEVVIEGTFFSDEELEKTDDLLGKIYLMLFPRISANVATVTSISGINVINIPMPPNIFGDKEQPKEEK